jgi:hypothetical protein
VGKFKFGKTHHSGYNKRGIGTFDIDAKDVTGAFLFMWYQNRIVS